MVTNLALTNIKHDAEIKGSLLTLTCTAKKTTSATHCVWVSICGMYRIVFEKREGENKPRYYALRRKLSAYGHAYWDHAVTVDGSIRKKHVDDFYHESLPGALKALEMCYEDDTFERLIRKKVKTMVEAEKLKQIAKRKAAAQLLSGMKKKPAQKLKDRILRGTRKAKQRAEQAEAEKGKADKKAAKKANKATAKIENASTKAKKALAKKPKKKQPAKKAVRKRSDNKSSSTAKKPAKRKPLQPKAARKAVKRAAVTAKRKAKKPSKASKAA